MFDSSILSQTPTLVWSGVILLISIFLYLGVGILNDSGSQSSWKDRQAKEMREAYESIKKENLEKNGSVRGMSEGKPTNSELQISELWIYPIKSIRGCRVQSAMITPEGFYLDRRYMLLKVTSTSPLELKNMHVPHFPSMCLFETSITANELVVSYNSPSSSVSASKTDKNKKTSDRLTIPLEPSSLKDLRKININMHNSPSVAYDMGAKYNDWFSTHFTFPVILAFWGGNPRNVLGNRPGLPATVSAYTSPPLTKYLSTIPVLDTLLAGKRERNDTIAFNDVAPFLVVNQASVDEVTGRLGGGREMDGSKFRPNIIVSSPKQKPKVKAYDEDLWSELTFNPASESASGGEEKEKIKISLTANCGRCASLNVDYETGDFGKGEEGGVLKALQGDRRVDMGMKWSPIFGRYGFAGKGDGRKVLRVGDGVVVSGRNEGGSRFYWPGLST